MVTCRSCIASSSALCTLAGARLISSASTQLAKMGPRLMLNSPVRGLKICVPITSAGNRSGVNWMRWKLSRSPCANVRTASVLARPGTPSSRTCPAVKRPMSRRSTMPRWPMMTFSISRYRGSSRPRISRAARLIWAASVLMRLLLQRRTGCRCYRSVPGRGRSSRSGGPARG